MKRIISFLLAALMLFSTFAVISFADADDDSPASFGLIIESKKAKPGDTVSVKVSLEEEIEAISFMFYDIEYDETQLKLIKGEWLLKNSFVKRAWKSDTNDASFMYETNNKVKGNIFEFKFEVLSTAACEVLSEIKCAARALYQNGVGQEDTIIYADVTNGGITVEHLFKNVTVKADAAKKKNGSVTPVCSLCGKKGKVTTVYYPKTFTLSAKKFTYTGKAIKPSVKVLDSKGKKIAASNYTVTYSNNKNVGTGKVTIKFKGNYSGTKTLTFTIVPKQVTGLKATVVKKDSVKLSWTKASGAKYYKIEQSTDGKKWKSIKITDKTNYTVSKLSAGKKYQYRVTALDKTKKISGKASSVLKTATLTKAPTLTLKSTKSKTVSASWKKVTGASKYVVYKSTNGKKWTKAATLTKTSCTLSKLTGGKAVYVKVTALNAYKKESAASSEKKIVVKK